MPTNISINMKHNIQLRVGGRYRNREGQEVSIVYRDDSIEWAFRDARGDSYRPDGTFSYLHGDPSQLDLVEEIPIPDPRIPILEARVAELEARLARPRAPARAPAPTTYRYFRSVLAEWRVAAGSEAAECRLIGKSEWGPAYTMLHELLAAKDRLHHPVRECDQDGRLLEAEPAPAAYRYFRSDRTEWRVANGGEAAEYRNTGSTNWDATSSTLKDLLAARGGWLVDVRECDQDGQPLEAEPTTAQPDTADTEPPNPGPGYRLVDRGELIETGDEWWEDGRWVETCFATEHRVTKDIDTPLRRAVSIEPKPPTYRLLRPGERIQSGDEGLAHMSITRGILDEWDPAEDSLGEPYDPAIHTPFRRRVAHYQDHP